MTDHLDSLVFAARRSGSDPRDSLRADLEVGWAYRLIQLYGTMRRPDFGEGCPARAILLKEGIPENMIPTIAETFRQEQAACRSRAFENALVEDMKRHGIEDTLVRHIAIGRPPSSHTAYSFVFSPPFVRPMWRESPPFFEARRSEVGPQMCRVDHQCIGVDRHWLPGCRKSCLTHRVRSSAGSGCSALRGPWAFGASLHHRP
ncbi:hypothetical protein [Oricola thermophila]|uniref:Uncharacterized protein n=1 Tax=Oricola thermophila TaxID=2742145 RepID=A0A6N1VDA7_9HYPH|nr:hypothetical protein HTY61_11350 [Oricola thermophila]